MPPLSRRFDDAFTYAHEVHGAQVRKGNGVPYIGHLIGVASIVIDDGGTEDEAIAALLHDAIEDQAEPFGGAPKLRAAIRERFGETVLAIVEGLTDADSVPKPPWKERKVAYLARLATAGPSILLVSCADKLHNARSTVADLAAAPDRDAYWKKFNGGKDGTLWYYRSLAKIFLERSPGRLSEELARAVLELTALVKPKAASP